MTESNNIVETNESVPGLPVRAFTCKCGGAVFFRNSTCLGCGLALGYAPELARLLPLELARLLPLEPVETTDVWVETETDGPRYRRCANLDTPAACNWLVPVDEIEANKGLCRACRLNRTIPALDDAQHPDNGELWRRIELAKRRLVSSLLVMGLPVASRETEDPERGLMFDFLRSPQGGPPVMTGHGNGLITLDIAEADDVHREQARTSMDETYRTLVGHLRHEVGHYYWDRLIQDSHWLDGFRDLFGDERADYAESLKRHYENGAPPDWDIGYVSSYATSHPWEDWAETWAHYMHISDIVDTANSYGLTVSSNGPEVTPFTREVLYQTDHPDADRYLAFVNHWAELTMMMNGMARAMGQPDIYPFVLAHKTIAKLHFIHLVITEERHRTDGNAPDESKSKSRSQSGPQAQSQTQSRSQPELPQP